MVNVYYVPNLNQFVQVYEISDDGWLCGGFSEYYDDAILTIRRQQISFEFIKECEVVAAIDQCPHAELVDLMGLKAWKVRASNP